MGTKVFRRAALLSSVAAALIVVGCSGGERTDAPSPPGATSVSTSVAPLPAELTLPGVDGVEVTLNGPIAAKYATATPSQKNDLGKPLTGDHNAGTRESGLVFQQFQGGVITAKSDRPGTPAYITSGRIRDAWNVQRDPNGAPAVTGTNGSAGPLGYPTSDVTATGELLVSTFEHGKITYNPATGQVDVSVNGTSVPSGLT